MDRQSTNPPPKREQVLFEVTVSGMGITPGAGMFEFSSVGSRAAGNALWLAFGLF